jgi:uncharacterized delta-60 repeat protein
MVPGSIPGSRFNSNGSIDTYFGGDGIVTQDLGGTEQINALITQSDGSIVVGGVTGSDFVIAKFDSSGVIDTTFGSSSGYTTTNLSGTDDAYALARQADGKFVAAGVSSATSSGNFAVARYTSSGLLDTTFGSTGKDTTDFGTVPDTAYGVVIGPDYKITAAGYSGCCGFEDFAVSRYCRRLRAWM